MDDAARYSIGGSSEPRPSEKPRREPTPIWQSKLYQERRERADAIRLARSRMRRSREAELLREKRVLADRLFDLCEAAQRAVHDRGGDPSEALAQIAELSFIVSYWDAETVEEEGEGLPAERLDDSRDLLAALVLASEVTKLLPETEEREDGPN